MRTIYLDAKKHRHLIALTLITLITLFSVGCKGGNTSEKKEGQLKSIDIVASPVATRGLSELTLAKGNTQLFVATGHYANGSKRDITKSVSWSSSNKNAANITANGLLTGENVGKTQVTASKDGIVSNSVSINVNDAVIDTIQITSDSGIVSIAEGQDHQLTAIGTYSNGTTSDISSTVTWTTSDPGTVGVAPTGQVTGESVGEASVSAGASGIISNPIDIVVKEAVKITAIQITPDSFKVAKGHTRQLKAAVTYSDGTTTDGDNVKWSPNDPAIVSITTDGLLTGDNVGSTSVSVSKDGVISNLITVEVTDAVVTDIQIIPDSSPVALAKGQTLQLTAMATYSDGQTLNISRDVAWFSTEHSSSRTVSVTPDGLLTAENVGSTNVTASKDRVISNTVTVDVSDAVITDIQITPDNVSLAKGQTQQLTAMVTYSDNATPTVDNTVAWLSDDIDTVTVTLDGLLTGVKAGNTQVTASKDKIIGNTVSVEVTPSWVNIVGIGNVLVKPTLDDSDWASAETYCQSLTIGKGSWTLPTKDQLVSIAKISQPLNLFPIDIRMSRSVGVRKFWTSTDSRNYNHRHYAITLQPDQKINLRNEVPDTTTLSVLCLGS